MKVMKKAIIFCLCICLFAVMLTACGGKEGGTKVVFTTGMGKDEVFRIGDRSCTRAEFMIYLATTKNQYEAVYGEEIWQTSLDGVTLMENVKETVLEKIAQIKTMYLLAKEKELSLSEQEEQAVKQAASEYFNSLSDVETELLEASVETVETLYTEYAMANKVYLYTIKDINPEISDDEARTITVQHIFMRTYTRDNAGNVHPVSESAKQEIYDEICKVRELALMEDKDFAALASKYSEDSTLTYSFGKGDMEPAIENVAFDLETGEISEIVEGENGYHIFKCISTFDREETDANKLQIVEKRRNEAFGKEYELFVETLAKRLNEKVWEEMELLSDSRITTSNFFDIYEKYFPENDRESR